MKKGFDSSDKELARIAKALSAPAKIAILKTLAVQDSCICGEIVEVTPLAQSTVSQHLKELKELGVIQGTIKGASSCYCIDPKGIKKVKDLFDSFFDQIEGSTKDCKFNR